MLHLGPYTFYVVLRAYFNTPIILHYLYFINTNGKGMFLFWTVQKQLYPEKQSLKCFLFFILVFQTSSFVTYRPIVLTQIQLCLWPL